MRVIVKNIDDIMKLQSETLALEQHKVLKQHTIDTLSKVIQLIKEEKYDKINEYVDFSAAGDGYGNENHYISFHYGDIVETTERLKYLKLASEWKS